MYKMLMLIFVFFLSGILYSHTRSDLEAMRNEKEMWIIGKGEASSETAADRMAINDLLSQISVQVEGSFTNIIEEDNGNIKEYCSSAIKTYSAARLEAAQRSIFDSDSNYIVYRYIKVEDRNKIFEQRENLIKDYARRADDAEKELRIGDALQNYYWSLVLLRTHPDWDKIEQIFNGTEETLISYLPDRISRIFSLLDLSISEQRFDEKNKLSLITVSVDFADKPVQNLDLKYYLGNDWSIPTGVSRGKALLEFLTTLQEVPIPLSINIMYNDFQKASHNNDLRNVLEEMEVLGICPVFRNSRFDLGIEENVIKSPSQPEILLQAGNEAFLTDLYEQQVNRLCSYLANSASSDPQSIFTQTGWEDYQKILQYGNARLIDNRPQLTIDKINDKVYMRGLPVQFNFPQSGRTISEELVISFDKTRRIDKIKFALSDLAVHDIMDKLQASDEEKYHLVNFIEEYKTAYCTKNIDFIEKVFDDNALIIVGQMLKDDEIQIEGMYNSLGKSWKAVQYSKQDYVKNLRRLYAINEYVNLHFEDNIITKTNDENSRIFGLQIHQYYYSQTYADEGYLFLMFDLTDNTRPSIYVRTWQPEKNPDGSIYGLDNFYLPR
jgi:hypothetical protein